MKDPLPYKCNDDGQNIFYIRHGKGKKRRKIDKVREATTSEDGEEFDSSMPCVVNFNTESWSDMGRRINKQLALREDILAASGNKRAKRRASVLASAASELASAASELASEASDSGSEEAQFN